MSSSPKVFGHKSPDTDSTCSAIIWSWYINTHQGISSTPYVLGTLNNETQFVLSHWGIETPALLESIQDGEDVVIVDTNNPQELFENIGEANVKEVIDHHKLSGLTTKAPLIMTIRPLASTASVMYEAMKEYADTMPKEIAGLVLSCILSDTLEFRSPTTTPRDKEIAEYIAQKYSIDLHALAEEMFAAKSDVSEFSDAQLINLDSKKYEVGDKNLRISTIETTSPAIVLARKEGIVAAIKSSVESESGVDDVLFFIVDILKEEATVLLHSDLAKQIIKASFGADVSGDTVVLPRVVSRKKQILPVLKI